MKTNNNKAEIYIHIPFCVRKCAYCDFLSAPADESVKESYVDALLREIDEKKDSLQGRSVTSIYFGGGTPSVLNRTLIQKILNKVNEVFCVEKDAEITIEVNPGTVSEKDFVFYKNAGINRLSIGLQSANDEELKRLGRIHDYASFLKCYEDATKAGFYNINVDLMSSLPGQSVEDYRENLEKIINLKPRPKHISSYSLIIEEGTPFFELHRQGKLALPTEEEDREMYELTDKVLKSAGFERYEISNYALKGYESRHNSGYWTGVEYLGLGIGASSYIEGVRYSNIRDIKKYISSDKAEYSEKITLSGEDMMEEFMFLGLRMTKGISVREFEERFGVGLSEIYGDTIKKHEDDGLLEYYFDDQTKKRLRLTKKGLDVSNFVFSDFILN
ncbi:MAG: radical SAM family heme chaperone HemW [Acetatifactor sp.]|nr:radical SAM family heme chaperone HemW [Acetatifactor sp.]